MNQFLLQQGVSQELLLFPYILEFGAKKNQQILLNSLRIEKKISIRFYYINEGKFEWQINNQCYTLYPGDAALIMPGCLFGSEKDLLDIGSITWLDIQLEKFSSSGRMIAGSWSHLTEEESNTIGKILSLSSRPILASLQEAGKLLLLLQKELVNQEIGYQSRVGQIADELLILAARQLTRQHNIFRDFPKTFTKLEQTLRSNLSHQWTVA